jgi:predicted ATPase
VRVLGGGCVPLGEEGLPFAPVIQALRGLAEQLDPAELQAVVGPARAELGRLLPDLAWAGETAAVATDPLAGQGVQRLDLGRFTRAEVAEQLAGLLGADPPTRLLDDLYARSEGNPFFAEELLLAGGDSGVLPPSLQEVLLTRIVRLGHRTQRLLGVAAVAGPGAAQPLLAVVAGMDEAELLDGLREAVDQQLLLPEPGRDGYLFRHPLLAEAVYAELLPGERVGLHTALARPLEAGLEAGNTPVTRAARIAYHWSAAGDQPRALTASIAAAAAAEGADACAEARLQRERVLALWDRVPDAEVRVGMDRVGLLGRCAEAAYGAGDIVRAAELVRQALGLVDAARLPRL